MRTVAQTALIMAVLTLISKCFGFVREMVMANYYGASYITDAYVMAVAVPSIIFGGILAAISVSYMPTFSHIAENEGEKSGNEFTSRIINILLILSVASSLLGILFSDTIVAIFASGFEGKTAELASFFVKITFCYILFNSVAGILESFLQYKGAFLPPIITGYLLSGATIIVTVICAHTSYYYLAFGMLIGYVLRFGILLFISRKKGYQYRPIFHFDKRVKGIFVTALPVFIGSSIQQINVFVDKTLASGLKEGSVSALNYANLLNLMIASVTISVLTTIIYPRLNQAYSLRDFERLNGIVETGMNLIVIIALPCSLGAICYSSQIVQIVYERGAFDKTATAMTGSAFLFFAIGLAFNSLSDLLIKTFYSMHDMKTPMFCAGINVLMNIMLSLILVRILAHNGLALATSIAGIGNFSLLCYEIKKKHPEIQILKSKKKLFKIITASFLAVGGSLLFYHAADILHMGFVQLLLAVLVAAVLYYIMLKFLKIDEVDIVKQLIKK